MSRLISYTKVGANQSEISKGDSMLKDREHDVFVEPMAREARVEGGGESQIKQMEHNAISGPSG